MDMYKHLCVCDYGIVKKNPKDYTWISKRITEEITLFKTFNVLIVTHNILMLIKNVNIYHSSIDDLIQSPVCFPFLNMKLFCGYFPKSFSYVPMHSHVPRNKVKLRDHQSFNNFLGQVWSKFQLRIIKVYY